MGDEEKKPFRCGLLANILRRGASRSGDGGRASSPPRPPPEVADPPKLNPSTAVPNANPAEALVLVPASQPVNPRPNPATTTTTTTPMYPSRVPAARRPRPPEPTKPTLMRDNSISTELDIMIQDHQRSKGSSNLVRASSSNVMVFRALGNIQGKGNAATAFAAPPTSRGNAQDSVVPRLASPKIRDAEELKEMGNEEYNKGRYAEAVALYDEAIKMGPDKASYHGNKAAALMGLGKLLEAVDACSEAVRIDPSYRRAHHRLATLYLRLGEAEKATYHYKQSQAEAKPDEISRAQALQSQLTKCNEARMLRDWHTMLEQAESAVTAGADSAPQVFASQADALLKLHRHEEADEALIDAPKYDIDASTKFFGATCNSYILAVQAEVDMAAGRFEEAVAVAQKAAQLDPRNREIGVMAEKAVAMATARSKGNDLFKASKFEEALTAYSEGLNHDTENAILLCNRAACKSKLGRWEKAIEDCNTALKLRPSYNKARLRRADCNAKLKRWEATIEDYEVLHHEMPGDEEVRRGLIEAQVQLKTQHAEDIKGKECDANLVLVTSEDQFRHIVMSPGLAIALFFHNLSEISNQMMLSMEQLCKQYSSVKFLKVDLEENPDIAESECVSLVPSLRIYKNGSNVKDIADSDHNQLESSLRKLLST